MLPMHDFTEETERLARAIEAYARDRIALPQPLDRTVSAEELDALAGQTISPDGIGWEEALRLWADVLAPATISTDHPTAFAFIPGAPTRASILFDLIVGASSTIAAGWIDGAGRDLGREPGAAMGRRPGRVPTAERRRLRVGRLGGQPVVPGHRPSRRG